MKRAFTFLLAIAMVLGISMQADASLELRGTDSLNNRLIYDTDLNVTWYDFTKSGANWSTQMTWASALSVSGGDLVGVYDDWRLPTTTQPDPSCSEQYDLGGGFPIQGNGYNCTGSEMGHLYYTELGNTAGGGLTNTDDFQHLLSNYYWSGTEYSAYTDGAWGFSTGAGHQRTFNKVDSDYAVAVRPGDVAVVPEPVSMVLFGVGGVVLGARRMVIRRRG